MTEKRKLIGSDLAKVDAHVITPEEYEEMPEWTDEQWDRAEISIGDRVIRPGRPPLKYPKMATNLRIDPDVIAYFKRKGAGWQTRINAALRKVAKLKEPKRKRA